MTRALVGDTSLRMQLISEARERSAATATFDTYAEAEAAANAIQDDPTVVHHIGTTPAMPMRSGYHSARAGHQVWIVLAGNAVLLRDGSLDDRSISPGHRDWRTVLRRRKTQ